MFFAIMTYLSYILYTISHFSEIFIKLMNLNTVQKNIAINEIENYINQMRQKTIH